MIDTLTLGNTYHYDIIIPWVHYYFYHLSYYVLLYHFIELYRYRYIVKIMIYL